MKIRYIANACFLITLNGGRRILTDPWFGGPCQQTWWNFPPRPRALRRRSARAGRTSSTSATCTTIICTPNLAAFDRATPVIIGAMNTPNLRNALAALGFRDPDRDSVRDPRAALARAGAEFLLFKDFHGNTRGDETEIHYDLDTSLYLFDADGTRLFLAVDNTILPPTPRGLPPTWGAPDIAQLPYVSASLFPMAMDDYDDARKHAATAALRARTAANFRELTRALPPKRVIPAGGEYVLGGPAAAQSRFLPQPLEAELAAELEGIGAGAACQALSGRRIRH